MNMFLFSLVAATLLRQKEDPEADPGAPAFEPIDDAAATAKQAEVMESTHGAGAPDEMVDPDACPEESVEMCKELWDSKLEKCQAQWDKHPEWFPMCDSPTYTDHTGVHRDCAVGICSEAYQAVFEKHEAAEDACSQFHGDEKAVGSCEQCSMHWPENVLTCMECEQGCVAAACEGVSAEECFHADGVFECHEKCMDKIMRRMCQSFDGDEVKHTSCEMCQTSYPEHVVECVGCGVECMGEVSTCEDAADGVECLTSDDLSECHTKCMEPHMAEEAHIDVAEDLSEEEDHYSGEEVHDEEVEKKCAVYPEHERQGCGVCEAYHPTAVLECMDCDRVCTQSDPCEGEACYESKSFFKCHEDCLTEHRLEQCIAVIGKGGTRFEKAACMACASFFPDRVLECMSCSSGCEEAECEGLGRTECLGNKAMHKCHDTCMASAPVGGVGEVPPHTENTDGEGEATDAEAATLTSVPRGSIRTALLVAHRAARLKLRELVRRRAPASAAQQGSARLRRQKKSHGFRSPVHTFASAQRRPRRGVVLLRSKRARRGKRAKRTARHA